MISSIKIWLKLPFFLVPTNNNYDDEDGGLKIDEDADPGKENLDNKIEDDIAEVDHSNGVSEEEEEPSMPGPGGDLPVSASKKLSFSFPTSSGREAEAKIYFLCHFM